MVRGLNGIERGPVAGAPTELSIMSGDAVDNAQSNELSTAAALLDGGEVRADSGGERYEGVQSPGWPDDFFWKPDGAAKGEDLMRAGYGFPLLPGVLERALSAFPSPGLRMPWLGCHGNHEEVSQGVGIVTPDLASAMVGFHQPLRLPDGIDRDAALETFVRWPETFMAGPEVPVAAAAARRAFTRKQLFAGARGFTASYREDGIAYYVHDTSVVPCSVTPNVAPQAGAA